VTNWHDDALLRLDRISWIVKPSSGPEGDKSVRVTEDADPESWHVQVHIYITINLFAIRFKANIFTQSIDYNCQITKDYYEQVLNADISVHRFRICEGISKGF
jgi:hypothetical protein